MWGCVLNDIKWKVYDKYMYELKFDCNHTLIMCGEDFLLLWYTGLGIGNERNIGVETGDKKGLGNTKLKK